MEDGEFIGHGILFDLLLFLIILNILYMILYIYLMQQNFM